MRSVLKSDSIRVKSAASLLPELSGTGLPQGVSRSSIAPWPWAAYTWSQMQSFQRLLLCGQGFWSARIVPNSAEKSNGAPVGGSSLSFPPSVDVFQSVPAETLAFILGKHRATSSPEFREFVRCAQLGLMVFPGFAGSGKTTAASVMVNAMLASPDIKRIYVSAPTNAAVSHICQRIHQIRVELVEEGGKVDAISQLRQAVILRGFQLHIEEDQVMQRLRAPQGQHRPGMAGSFWHPSSWTLENSLAFFTLQALGFASDEIPDLDDKSSPLLLKLRDSLATCSRVAGLRRLACRSISHEDYLDEQQCDKDSFQDLLRKVASCASVICTTPETSANSFFEPLKRTSDVVVLNAAGAMGRADAINVWGNACRPCIIVGDWKQMGPTLLSSRDTFFLEDDYCQPGQSCLPRNRFFPDGEASILEHAMRIGQPVWHLDHQYRMAVGQFEMALEVVYSEFISTYSCDESTELVHRPLAVEVDAWLSSEHGITSPKGKSYPAFFSKPGSCWYHPPSGSRYNEEQNTFALNLVRSLHEAGIHKSKMKVVTTYSDNKRYLEDLFRKSSFLDVACHTIDSFNGGIGCIVIFVLCVNRVSGPCFMDDSRRLAVAMTRHTDHLIVVGDLKTLYSDEKGTNSKGSMLAMFQWLSRNDRVVVVDDDAGGDDAREMRRKRRKFRKSQGWRPDDSSTDSDDDYRRRW